ncbi:hypothetical protein ACLX1H_002238 [Fusarium chlamydosporum]
MDPSTKQKRSSRNPGERLFKTTKTCSIPRLTDLRNELGYGTPGVDQDIAFKKAIRTQVETFVSSSDNIPAYKLTKWKNPAHQRGLLEVTKDFLEVQGKGPEFWPSSDIPDNSRPLQYHKDSASLMTKVFWRVACEYKRYRRSPSGVTQLLSQSIHETSQPIKTEDSSTDIGQWSWVFDDKGQSADNPIDLDDAPSDVSTPRAATDNDPFATYTMLPWAFVREYTFHTTDTSHFEPVVSDLPNMANGQTFESANVPVSPEGGNGTAEDIYDGPNSPPPPVTQKVHRSSKRPAEPSSSNTNRPSKAARNQGKRGRAPGPSNREPTRKSERTPKPRNNPDAATTSQVDASIASPPSSVSENGTNEERAQPSNGNTSCQASQASSSLKRDAEAPRQLTTDQSSTLSPREAVARRDREQTAAVAAEVGVDEEPAVVTGLSATAQGKQPAVPPRPVIVTQAGPSGERETIEEPTLRTEATAPVTVQPTIPPTTAQPGTANGLEGNDPGEQEQGQDPRPRQLDEREQEALINCNLICRSNVREGRNYTDWEPVRFPETIFQVPLAAVFQRLGLHESATLYIKYVISGSSISQSVQMNEAGQADFAAFNEECVSLITNQHGRAAPSRRPYIYLSNAPVRIG